MQMLKLLIADGSEEFRLALTEQLAGSFVIRGSIQGKQTLEMIRSFKPDILVLDLMLPELDGISLLQRLHEEGPLPIVLATTRFVNVYVMDAVTQLGVGYVMVKPCDICATAERIRDLSSQRPAVPLARPDTNTVISNVLLELGFATKHRGYQYLRESVAEMIRNPGQMVTKELYPTVGKSCGANKDQVERCIRGAIDSAFKIRDESAWRRYFRPDGDGKLRRPSNSTLINTLADRLGKSEMGEIVG